MNNELRIMNKKFLFVILGFGCALSLGAWAFSRTSHELTTNLDLEHGRIMSDGSRWDDSFSDLAHIFDNLSGSLLAAASSRYVYVPEGLRKEEVAELFADKLNWDKSQELAFLSAPEGSYYPGVYSIPSSQDHEIMRELMLHRFEREIEDNLASSTRSVISLASIVKVASLIEREAGGKRDMRLISGVIWNRIFKGMTLDIDATLQYAKGNEDMWWPIVLPGDSKINSPYNTYKYKGFPPTPIASPGLASIEAALNPTKTTCLFYLHDTRRKIHCADTYKGHLKNIDKYY